MHRALLIASVCSAGVAHAESPFAQGRGWEWRVMIGNDAFTEVTPPIDDNGFTTDLAFTLRRWLDPYVAGVSIRHRWITEVTSMFGGRRWDQLELLASLEYRYGEHVTTGMRLGPSFGGNFGGRWAQNGWHDLSGTGSTLEEGLQSNYDGDREVGGVVGGFGSATIGDPDLQAYAVIDAQGALGGTGVTSFEAVGGGGAAVPVGRVKLGVRIELGVAWYHIEDRNLELPGGYGTGDLPLVWRAGVHVAWHRFRVEYTYRANEGGSGEPIGTIEFIAAR